jgi:hypothetical protein
MISKRYGCLHRIGRRTSHRCHLCGEPVDLYLYGRPGLFGSDTVTVDHLVPQAFGGSDEPDNLMVAHAGCNSSRGTLPVETARQLFGGDGSAPWSTTARSSALGIGVGVVAGVAFAPRRDGTVGFNTNAALGWGIGVGVLSWLLSSEG